MQSDQLRNVADGAPSRRLTLLVGAKIAGGGSVWGLESVSHEKKLLDRAPPTWRVRQAFERLGVKVGALLGFGVALENEAVGK